MVSFVLVEPQHPGNIGFVARVIKNFGFSTLILINPPSGWKGESLRYAKHAEDVIHSARTYRRLTTVTKKQYCIATTAQVGSDDNIRRTPVSLPDLKTSNIPFDSKTAILFGRESDGLTNEEIAQCDVLLTIPASAVYPTLNLSHAVAIVAYELNQSVIIGNEKEKRDHLSHIRPMEVRQKQKLYSLFNELVDRSSLAETKCEPTKVIVKKLVSHAGLSRRESFTLIGFCKKLLRSLR